MIPRTKRIRSALVGIVTLAFLASGCGGDAQAEDAEADQPSPMSEYFGWDDEDYDPVTALAEQNEIESKVAECMRAEGFEYTPVEQNAEDWESGSEEDADLWKDPKAYGAKYGYGVVKNYLDWEVENIQDELDGNSDEEEYVPTGNDLYAQNLPPAEQEAYWNTLYGGSIEVEEENGDISGYPDPDEPGCYNSAQEEVQGSNQWSDPEFSEKFDELSSGMEDDPRLVTAQRAWVTCMGDTVTSLDLPAGFSVSGPNDMYQVFDMEKASLMGQDMLPMDPETGEPIGDFDWEDVSGSFENADGSGYAMVGKRELIPDDQLEGLRQREIDTFEKDFACQNEAGTFTAQHAVEQDMVDQLSKDFPSADGGE